MQTFRVAPFPNNEARRLAALADYALLDSGAEDIFDSLTRIAAHLCGTPISLIGLIDRDRQWFKSNTGLAEFDETPRDITFCAHAILSAGITEVPDALQDERFANNPLVCGYPHIRFYAGVPLVVAGGEALGTLCVIDREPRVLTFDQRVGLLEIAALVVAQFERRRARRNGAVTTAAKIGDDGIPVELQNERLTTLATIARNLFDALDPRGLVDALVRGVAALTGGGTALLIARGVAGQFVYTCNLAGRADAPVPPDELLEAAARSDQVILSADGSRAAVQIPAPSGALAYVLDIRALHRTFGPTDAFALGLLGGYLAVAVRNVELFGELQSRRAAVVELNQVKNDLIAMLAHDFKGPLTTIVGLADVLAEDERFDAESRRFLGMINSSAMRLASLATDTLALSRLDQNELSLRFEPVDVIALVRDIVRVFSVTRGIDLRCAAGESIVQADPARLRQVFENLIGNAIKYSPRGDAVGVIVRDKRGGVEVAITDHGIGIPPADLPKLFGRFARASNARELGIGGTGFGLYLARTIVERHGGQITVESKEGSGSTFRVVVPAIPASQRTRDRRILLLDNEGDGRSFIAHTLRDEGYAVYPVANETELFTALDERRYDAAIVDCDGLTGTPAELVERIAGRAPLVRLVSIAEPDASTGQAVLRKPFLIKDLQVLVDAAVADRRRGARRSNPDR